MKGKSLPNSFWAKYIVSSIYFFNICTTRSVENMTPYEACTGEKRGVDHLKVFSCIAYAHVPTKKQKKELDYKSVKCILIGYCEQKNAYIFTIQKIKYFILVVMCFLMKNNNSSRIKVCNKKIQELL
jgi:2-keto-3-deoxy-6-phosphogluconate aldolase